ncbi:tRNA lysidine(34) synthetase TilS [Mycoplasma struthionis]|uniref:tRNA(Ile)-lysidine synthase n=1 Tax=Mycoplasma struthionis TaxID=538220 RepID=A0A3G8LGR5_9MOLU|nr:tRNA lysidine(34) synthetase TilS [Mycoplasma struthionis]AZG68485.1 tRNA lysidine(34) synthetase TilS [Mycoplasma struthionis]
MTNRILELLKNLNIDKKTPILIGNSGGPDSMFLSYILKDYNLILVHVNYHKRKTSDYDQSLVYEFAKKINKHFEVLEIKHSEKQSGNFQAIAREERYDFYKQMAKKYNTNILFLAHHKDDFLETAIMQENSKRMPEYWGIKKENQIDNLLIYRPLLDYFWKDEIKNYMLENNYEFAIDYTNDLPEYTRNKIRLELKKISVDKKQLLFDEYNTKNVEKLKQTKEIKELYDNWKNQDFDCDFLKKQVLKKELVFYLIHNNFKNIKLSKNKLENIILFLESKNRTSKYKLADDIFLYKQKNMIKYSI